MEDTIPLPPLIDDLSANVDDLTEALVPLLDTPLSTRASSLPLLDKAKLHIYTAYAIESLIFSSLLVSGQNAKEHPIFAELGRLKAYNKKIKDAELGPTPRTRIDKGAVGRFIKHGLAGNDKYDKEREERILKEKARAKLAEQRMHVKFDKEDEDPRWQPKDGKKRKVEESNVVEEEDEHGVSSEDLEMYGEDANKTLQAVEPATKKARVSAADMMDLDSPVSADKKAKKNKKKKGGAEDSPSSVADGKTKEQLKAERRARKEQRKAAKASTGSKAHQSPMVRQAKKAERQVARGFGMDGTEESILPPKSGGPKTHGEAFQALLERPLSRKDTKS